MVNDQAEPQAADYLLQRGAGGEGVFARADAPGGAGGLGGGHEQRRGADDA